MKGKNPDLKDRGNKPLLSHTGHPLREEKQRLSQDNPGQIIGIGKGIVNRSDTGNISAVFLPVRPVQGQCGWTATPSACSRLRQASTARSLLSSVACRCSARSMNHLVVGVDAAHRGARCRLGPLDARFELGQQRGWRAAVGLQPFRDRRVMSTRSNSSRMCGGGQPAQFARFQRGSQRLRGADRRSLRSSSQLVSMTRRGSSSLMAGRRVVGSRIGARQPASRSKRNRRHSIGPFHIGTRRDSLKRILDGSFRSGVSSRRSSRRNASFQWLAGWEKIVVLAPVGGSGLAPALSRPGAGAEDARAAMPVARLSARWPATPAAAMRSP